MKTKNTAGDATSLYHQVMKHVEVGLWNDRHNAQTFSHMLVGLLSSHSSNIPDWMPFVQGKALFAQSIERRFRRFLNNPYFEDHPIYTPLIRQALKHWGDHPLTLALDTSMLFKHFCWIQISVLYRGRAVPLVWQVIEHHSSTVGCDVLLPLLDRAQQVLQNLRFPSVLLLADRAFGDLQLMQHLTQLGWHDRIRLKGNRIWQDALGVHHGQLGHQNLQPGEARFLQTIRLTKQQYGPVHVALGRPFHVDDVWCVVSDQPTSLKTFEEYAQRFQIEEGFLDEKSAACHLEDSHLRTAQQLQRLLLVLSVALLLLISLGTALVACGQRRWVDPHWKRGLSDLRLGWRRLRHQMSRGKTCALKVLLLGGPDPEPCPRTGRKRFPPTLWRSAGGST